MVAKAARGPLGGANAANHIVAENRRILKFTGRLAGEGLRYKATAIAQSVTSIDRFDEAALIAGRHRLASTGASRRWLCKANLQYLTFTQLAPKRERCGAQPRRSYVHSERRPKPDVRNLQITGA